MRAPETRYGFTVEAIVGAQDAPRIVEGERVSRALEEIASALGSLQSAHAPRIAKLSDGAGAGVSGSLRFPGGTVAIHTYARAGRIPGRYSVEITAGERIDPPRVFAALERALGAPESFEASRG